MPSIAIRCGTNLTGGSVCAAHGRPAPLCVTERGSWAHWILRPSCTAARLLFLVLQVLHSFPRERVDKAVTLNGTPASVGIREYREALEAELGPAVPTEHLVALLPLRPLRGQILLAHTRLALGALLRPCTAHPTHEASVRSLDPLLPTPSLRRMRLAGDALMVWLRPTA